LNWISTYSLTRKFAAKSNSHDLIKQSAYAINSGILKILITALIKSTLKNVLNPKLEVTEAEDFGHRGERKPDCTGKKKRDHNGTRVRLNGKKRK